MNSDIPKVHSLSSDLHQELAVRMQKNLELEKTAEKTDIDGKKDEKRKSHIKKDVKTDSIGTSLHKVQNGAIKYRVFRHYMRFFYSIPMTELTQQIKKFVLFMLHFLSYRFMSFYCRLLFFSIETIV